LAHETEEHLKPRGAKRRPRQTVTIWPYYGERSETLMSRILSMVHATRSMTSEALTRRQARKGGVLNCCTWSLRTSGKISPGS
jgi:hypothetical protein